MKRLVIAHRGASAQAHQNTVAAFEKAFEAGADMVEFDVRRTGDGVLVVHHDPLIGDRPISRCTLAELCEAATTSGFALATVDEVLSRTQGRLGIDVELKELGYEDDVVRLLQRFHSSSEICVTSFYEEALTRVRATDPGIRTGLLVEPTEGTTPEEMGARSAADFLAPRYDLVAAVSGIGKMLFVWTVDDPSVMTTLLRHPQVEGLITNRPDVARRVRDLVMIG